MQKQILLVAAIALIAITSLQAQDFSRFKFGLQLSPTFSWISTDDSRIDGNGANTGLKLGTQAEFYFAENYAITTGIGFHFNAGGKLTSEYAGQYFVNSDLNTPNFPARLDQNVALDYAVQYVEIPLSLKLRTREFGYFTYYLDAPMFFLAFRGKSTGSLSGGGQSLVAEDVQIKKEVSPLALSWGFGAGAEYSLSESTRAFAGLQYQSMFTDMTKDKDYIYDLRTAEGDPKATMRALSVKLGVLF